VPRLVLLSDGNADAEPALLAARSLDVRIDTVPLPSLGASEVYIRQILAPVAAPAGLPFDVEVVIQATRDGEGVVSLQNGSHSEERKIRIHEGENRVRFRRWLTSLEPGTFTATISEFEDALVDNNSMSIVVAPRGKARVLLVESDPGSTSRLQKVLEEVGGQIEISPPQEMPKEASLLNNCDLMILSNIAPNLLTTDQQRAIQDFVKNGGGLIVIGGDQAFRRRALADSALERILPIKALASARAADATLAMVLVIDRSKSMEPTTSETADKMALAKQAANLAIDILQPTDKVGVIAFSDNTHWVSDLRPAADKPQLKERIDAIVAEGGTNMYAALDKAYLALRRADSKLKHVIVLTDGISVPGNFKFIASQMAEEGITISTVAIGKGVAEAVLVDISRAGRGKHYVCQHPDNLPEIVAGEARRASETAASEQPFRAQAIHVPPRLVALDIDEAPQLSGYAETTPKSEAELVLTSETGDPLLAWWRYGSGTVVAFTSDAEMRWASTWAKWPGYDEFWRELAHMAMRRANDDNVAMQSDSNGDTARILVDVTNDSGQFVNGAAVTLHRDENDDMRLRQTLPGRYEMEISADTIATVNMLSVATADGTSDEYSLGTIQNYPAELQLQPTNTALLEEIAKHSGGRSGVSAEAVFDADGHTAFRVVPLWPFFVSVALIAFLLDVALRRVDINQLRSRLKT
jgi:uncharacterized membrane protein